jgi:hypothetical protein
MIVEEPLRLIGAFFAPGALVSVTSRSASAQS